MVRSESKRQYAQFTRPKSIPLCHSVSKNDVVHRILMTRSSIFVLVNQTDIKHMTVVGSCYFLLILLGPYHQSVDFCFPLNKPSNQMS